MLVYQRVIWYDVAIVMVILRVIFYGDVFHNPEGN